MDEKVIISLAAEYSNMNAAFYENQSIKHVGLITWTILKLYRHFRILRSLVHSRDEKHREKILKNNNWTDRFEEINNIFESLSVEDKQIFLEHCD